MSAVLAFALSPAGRWIASAAVVLAILGALWADHAHLKGEVAKLQQKAASEHASAAISQATSNAQSDAAKIIDQGRAKADVTVHIQQENHDALLSSPGAQASVDPQLYSTLVGGLCKYAAYSGDPFCAKLRSTDPSIVPPAHSTGADTSGNDWGFSSSARPANGPT